MRCLVVDDSPLFRAAARALLEAEGLDVVGVAASGREALHLVVDLEPGLVLVDVDLGDEDGFEVAGQVARLLPHAAVVMVSTRSAEEYADRLHTAPVRGFLAKERLSRSALESLVGLR